MPSITLNKKTIDYTIRRSRRTKNVKISIKSEGQVMVSLPQYFPDFVAKNFLKEHSDWVLKKLLDAKPRLSKKKLVDGSSLNYLGKKHYKLRIFSGKGKRSFLREQFGELHFFQGSECEDVQAELRSHLENFYRGKARQLLTKRALFFAEQLNVKFNRVFIKNQQTRWGSCSAKKNLNFNWRIMLASRALVDYLVIHEVCHLREMNHGRKFWALVERFDADFEAHKKFLRDGGKGLDF